MLVHIRNVLDVEAPLTGLVLAELIERVLEPVDAAGAQVERQRVLPGREAKMKVSPSRPLSYR